MGEEHAERAAPRLRSKQSIHYSFIRFVNRTNRNVDVVWVNYEGARVKYKTLSPEQFLDMNTFAGHPWIFFDSETGDRMVVQLKEIFEPVAWNSESDSWPPQRKIVNITLPGEATAVNAAGHVGSILSLAMKNPFSNESSGGSEAVCVFPVVTVNPDALFRQIMTF